MARDWKYISIFFFTLERVIESGILDNVTNVVMNIARIYGSLSKQKIKEKLITFGKIGCLSFKVQNLVL